MLYLHLCFIVSGVGPVDLPNGVISEKYRSWRSREVPEASKLQPASVRRCHSQEPKLATAGTPVATTTGGGAVCAIPQEASKW